MQKELVTVQTASEKEMLATASKAITEISPAMDIKVTSGPTLEKAGEYLKVVGKAKKVIDGERTKIVKPINESVKRINDLFKPLIERAQQIERYLKQEVDIYAEKLRKEAEERAKEAAEKVASGERVGPATKKFENTTVKLDKIPTRTYWEVKIVDFSKVSDDYKILDETKAQAAAKAGIKVDGLEFRQYEKVINRF